MRADNRLQHGAASIEYALLASLIAAVAIVGIRSSGIAVRELWESSVAIIVAAI